MIGIVIVNYNSADDCKVCIASIKSTFFRSYRIYLVDNQSTDNSYQKLKHYYRNDKEVSLILNDYNNGYSAGNNLGIKKAIEDKCKAIVISNPDVIYLDNTLCKLSKLLQKKDVNILSPMILDENMTQSFVHMYSKTNLKEKFLVRSFLKRFNFNKIVDKYFGVNIVNNSLHTIYAPSGCCFAVDSSIFDIIFPLDENLFLYSEEYIIADKLFDANIPVYYDPTVSVIHKEERKKKVTAFQYINNVSSELYYLYHFRDYSFIKVFSLLCLRIFVYFIKCFNDKDFRNHFRLLFIEINKRLEKNEKQNSMFLRSRLFRKVHANRIFKKRI